MARYVVTGGGGFIGSHLVEHLLNEGQDVVVIDNFLTGRRDNLEPFVGRISMHEIDLRNLDDVRKAMQGADYVLHQGALPSVPRSIEQPGECHEVNATGTLNALIAAKDNGVKRFVYAASSSAYGDADAGQKHEGLVPQPISPYGTAKLNGEFYCKAFYHSYGLETVCLRYFNVFGPRQNPDSPYTGVMAIFIPLMLQDKQPVIYGDGSATRDFTYVHNNVHANLLAVQSPNVAGETINIACGESQSVLETVQAINDALGKNIEPVFKDPRPGDILHSCASIEKAKERLDFKPVVRFEEGVKKTIEWYRQNLNLPN